MRKGKKMGRLIAVTIFLSFMTFIIPKSGLSQQKYPENPITIIFGWGPGGQLDIFTRILGNAASKILGQPIVVEYKPGAHGLIAAHTILRSKPDGYTLGIGNSTQFLIASNMQKVDFDPMNDPTWIMTFLHYDLGLCVRSDSPWKTWEEFKAYAKQNPGKVTYSCAAVGGAQHLAMETIARKEGIKWVLIPFPSGNGPVIALLGGHVEATIQGPADVIPHIQAGKLRFLLSFNKGRWPIAPDAPYLGELGYDNTFSYCGVYGPKGLPESIRTKLEYAFHEAMKDQVFVDAGHKSQLTIVYVGGNEITKMIKERFPKYKKLVEDMGLVEK